MKKILIMLLFCHSALAVDLTADISVGSIVGQDDPTGAQLPFWAEGYASQVLINDFASETISLIGGIGHRSNADLNGNEFNGEFALLGFEFKNKYVFAKGTVRKFFRGGQSSGDEILMSEIGLSQGSFRFTAFWRDDKSRTDYDITGLKVGYQFKYKVKR